MPCHHSAVISKTADAAQFNSAVISKNADVTRLHSAIVSKAAGVARYHSAVTSKSTDVVISHSDADVASSSLGRYFKYVNVDNNSSAITKRRRDDRVI